MAAVKEEWDWAETQGTTANASAGSSTQVSTGTGTPATSFQDEAPPPYSLQDSQPLSDKQLSYDEQIRLVEDLCKEPIDEGDRGCIVSMKWLARVKSRSTAGEQDSQYPKEARQGPIGQVDNSDVVPDGGFSEPILKDPEGHSFIPLRRDITPFTDFEIITTKAWGHILSWYGVVQGQKEIVRYAHNTAPEAPMPNIQYDLYPPILTICKVEPSAVQVEAAPPKSSTTELRLRKKRQSCGQLSPDDAVQLVSSSNERFKKFLIRAKEAAGIPTKTKVRLWKLLEPSNISVDDAADIETGVMSPPASRSASPRARQAPTSKLLLDLSDFNKMEIGKDLESIDADDVSADDKYNGTSTVDQRGICASWSIILEECTGGPGGGEFASDKKKPLGKFGLKKPTDSKPASATNSGRTSPAPGIMTRGRQKRDGKTRGTVGLSNLGNTCYMNSALQCIRSVEELAIYFLSNRYKSEINSSNPLGHGGVMAKHYANLLSNIYSETAASSITPKAFKGALGNLQPLFSGYGQQDSQEFLSFLVDALHEDLNRIQKKPYNENPDSDDSTVHDPQAIVDLGNTYRSNHQARNDSIAMDLFSGFYKNTMECPSCDKISITFDPFSLVTLQLPVEGSFQHNITFVPLRGKPINHRIDMDKNATIRAMKENVASKHKGVDADRLWMAEVYSHKIFRVFDTVSTLGEASIGANDYIFLFELEAAPSNTPVLGKKSFSVMGSNARIDTRVPDMDDEKADSFAVPIFSRQKGRYGDRWDTTLHPMYILVTREEAKDYDTVLKKVLFAVSRLTSRPSLTDAEAEDSGTPEKDHSAQLSDRSVPSEDGYVEVSKSDSNGAHEAHVNGNSALDTNDDDRRIPARFMDESYFLPASLRNQLFQMNYAPAASRELHCSSMKSFDDPVRAMHDRIKPPTPQESTQSSSDDDESTTSTASTNQANAELEESDESDMDKPDITLGGEESTLSMPTPSAENSDDESMANAPVTSRKGRRKKFKGGKGKRGKPVTYSKKAMKRKQQQQSRPDSQGSLKSIQSQKIQSQRNDNDNPYYIKLGEGIVLDWYPEAFQKLFGGSIEEGDGHFTSHPDGKNLEFVDDPEIDAKNKRRKHRRENGITLEDCFHESGKREVLSEDNSWYCNRCKELRRATKTLDIWTIPDILVVHLKRFGGNRSFRDKIDTHVHYPIEGLDMTDRVGLKEDGKEYVYDLFAVDNHYGGLGGGHYTAMAKNFYDGQWYDYNDSSCHQVREANLHSAAAYLLFYRRRSATPLGPQYLQDLVLASRNPPEPSAQTADDAANDSDAGEGRLGGPNGSQPGSSSALTGAAAAAANPRGLAAGGAGAAARVRAGSPQTTRTTAMSTSSDDSSPPGEAPQGPSRPPHMLGNSGRGSGEWSFANLGTGDMDGAGYTQIRDEDDDGDAGSTTAEFDSPFGARSQKSSPHTPMRSANDSTEEFGGLQDAHESMEYDRDVTMESDSQHVERAGDDGEARVDVYTDEMPDVEVAGGPAEKAK